TRLLVKSVRATAPETRFGLPVSPKHLVAIAFPSMHLVAELLLAGRQRGLRPHVFLKPFTHRIADVTAGLVVDLIGVVVDLGHCHRHG
ncbi:MAG: hypothetical protein ACK463_20290, partial [Bradyrhizobium sp.]